MTIVKPTSHTHSDRHKSTSSLSKATARKPHSLPDIHKRCYRHSPLRNQLSLEDMVSEPEPVGDHALSELCAYSSEDINKLLKIYTVIPEWRMLSVDEGMTRLRMLEMIFAPSVTSAAEADARLAHALAQPLQPFPMMIRSEQPAQTGQVALAQPVQSPSKHGLPSSRMLTRQPTLEISQEPQPQQAAPASRMLTRQPTLEIFQEPQPAIPPSRRLRRQSGLTRSALPLCQGASAPSAESSTAAATVSSHRSLTRQPMLIEPAPSLAALSYLTNEHLSVVPSQSPASTSQSPAPTCSILPLVRRVYSAGVIPPSPIVQFDPRGSSSANQSAPLFVSGRMKWALKHKVSLRESGRKIRSSTTRALNGLPKKDWLLALIARKRKQQWDALESQKRGESAPQRLALPPASASTPSISNPPGSPPQSEWLSLPERAGYTPSPTAVAYITTHATNDDGKPLSPEEIDPSTVLLAHRVVLEQMPLGIPYNGPHTADCMRRWERSMERRRAEAQAKQTAQESTEMNVDVAELEGREKQVAILPAREHQIAQISDV